MSITKTRQTLVEVARKLFAQKGFDATTMNDISVESGKGRRTLYTYFKNKEDIYYAVIEGELERLSERMDEVAHMDISPEQKVLLLIYTHLNMIKETVARNGSLRAEFFRNIWTTTSASSSAKCSWRVAAGPSSASTTLTLWPTSCTTPSRGLRCPTSTAAWAAA